MSRRRVDQARRSKAMGHGQQAVWDEIRKLKNFTIADLWGVVDMKRGSILDYVKRLMAGGYVVRSGDVGLYALTNDAGVHAPRLTKDGKPVTQGGGTQNMWRSMRMLKQFTPRDLALHSNTDTVSVTELTARSYCSMLLKAGYLRVLQKAVPSKRQASYKFIRDTGPKAPQIQRVKQVFDPNLNEVTYTPEPRS